MSNFDYYAWSKSSETQRFLDELDKDIIKIQNEILEFGGLLTSPYLEREYSHTLGMLSALKKVKKYIEEIENETT